MLKCFIFENFSHAIRTITCCYSYVHMYMSVLVYGYLRTVQLSCKVTVHMFHLRETHMNLAHTSASVNYAQKFA